MITKTSHITPKNSLKIWATRSIRNYGGRGWAWVKRIKDYEEHFGPLPGSLFLLQPPGYLRKTAGERCQTTGLSKVFITKRLPAPRMPRVEVSPHK